MLQELNLLRTIYYNNLITCQRTHIIKAYYKYLYNISKKYLSGNQFECLIDNYMFFLDTSELELNENDYKLMTKKKIVWKVFPFIKEKTYKFSVLLIIEIIVLLQNGNCQIESNLIGEMCKFFSLSKMETNFVVEFASVLFEKEKMILLNEMKAFFNAIETKYKRYIKDTVFSFINNMLYDFTSQTLSEKHIFFCSVVSTGKSTIINALLGDDILPAKNEPCTAKKLTICNNNLANKIIGYAVTKNHEKIYSSNVNKTVVDEWNSNANITEIYMVANLCGINSNDINYAIHDTPGVNAAEHDNHSNETYLSIAEAITNNKLDLLFIRYNLV